VQEERSLPYDSTSAGYGKQARLVDLDMDGDLDIMIQSPHGFMVIANQDYRTDIQEPLTPFIPKAALQLDIYPNPFNSTTTISFIGEAEAAHVYDIRGRVIRSWDNSELLAGNYRLLWDGKNNFGHTVSSGVYLVQFITKEKRVTKKVAFLR